MRNCIISNIFVHVTVDVVATKLPAADGVLFTFYLLVPCLFAPHVIYVVRTGIRMYACMYVQRTFTCPNSLGPGCVQITEKIR